MPKFILIDQSLRDLGGHHYPYAQTVLSAAQHSGWQPVLAVNRRFSQRAALPTDWRVHALFAHESYSRHTLDTQARLAAGAAPAGGWQPRGLAGWWRNVMRRRRAAHFARDCARVFALEPLERGDLIFLATMSELDLWGLGEFLRRSGAGTHCSWHLQFHFGVFHGREPDYDAQAEAAQAMRASLAGALRLCGQRDLHFHCTTTQLTAQYQRLGVARFGTLAYPVHELFRPRAGAPSAPLRIACLGHSRREKGYGQLPPLLRALWRDWFGPGRAQLVLQTHHGRQRRALEALVASLGTGGTKALDFAAFPLPLNGYAELLCGADVGLMLYDPTRYYARCSGVLLEMLCAGVPVLVPAGSWLAAQIEEPNQRYLDAVAARAGPAAPLALDAELRLPPAATMLLLECRWRADAMPGEYLRLELSAQDGAGAGGTPLRVVLGARTDTAPVRSLLRLPPGCARLRVTAHNAWRQAAAPAGDFSWSWLEQPAPMGALGLTIAAPAEIPRLLQDVLEHSSHYRRLVREQSADCARAHSGAQVLADLGAPGAANIAGERPTT
jgi:hypothetical protein